MSVTLVIAEDLASELLAAAQGPVETAGVLLARLVVTPSGDHRLLARTVHLVPDDAYQRRTSRDLLIASTGYVPALAAAEADGCVPIWLHTHPGDGASPRPSARDAHVDRELADLFRLRAASAWYGAIVLAHDGAGLAFDGHIESERGRLAIDRLWSVGRRFALIRNHDQAPLGHNAIFDRNIRAFGGGVQDVLGDLRVAVVGCGGTGSAVIEQLTRLGVRRFSLFDPDTLADTNTTRVYGSSPADVGRAKADVAADHVRRIAPDAQVTAFGAKITSLDTALQTARRRPRLRLHRRQRRPARSLAAGDLLPHPGPGLGGAAHQRRRWRADQHRRTRDPGGAGLRVPGLPGPHRHEARGGRNAQQRGAPAP